MLTQTTSVRSRPPACAQGHQHVLTDHERALTQTTSVRSDDQHALTDHQRAPIQITSVPPNLDGWLLLHEYTQLDGWKWTCHHTISAVHCHQD